MFQLLKWAVLGCIALAAVNALTHGRLREELEGSLARRSEDAAPAALARRIQSSEREVERGEREVASLRRELASERNALAEIEASIAALEQRQRETLQRASSLEARLETGQERFQELSGTYARSEIESQAREAWRAMELQELELARRKDLRAARCEKIEALDRGIEAELERQHRARLEILRAEARLAELRSENRQRPRGGRALDAPDPSGPRSRELAAELGAFERERARVQAATPLDAQRREELRREMQARYGEPGTR
jgi:chromosome segregation ATPase